MAFNSNTPRNEYTASSGQTIFPFDFQVFNNTDLVIYLTPNGQSADDTTDLLTLTTDYTVAIIGESGGSITLTSAATSGDAVTITRSLPIDRDTEYQERGDLRASTLNDDQDYQTQLINDISARNSRVVTLPESSQGVSGVLPTPKGDYYLKWTSDAKSLENSALFGSDFKDLIIVSTINELSNIDTNLFTTAIVKDINRGGLFIYYSAQSAVNNGGTIFDGWVRQYDGAVNVDWFITNDDSAGITKASVFSHICFSSSKTYNINSSITLSTQILIDINGASITNSTPDIFVFHIASSGVSIINGKFYGTQIGIATIDELADIGSGHEYSDILIDNNIVDCVGAKQVVITYAFLTDFRFTNNICRASGTIDASSCGLHILGDVVEQPTSGEFSHNIFDGYGYAYRMNSSGYVAGLVRITDNTVINSIVPFSLYHHRNTIVSGNTIDTFSEPLYAWQMTTWFNNIIKNYTGINYAIKIEAFVGSFKGNTIDTSGGHGILYDGSGQSGVIEGNTIKYSTGDGIHFEPTYNYGGQPVSIYIKDNIIYGCGLNGISLISSDNIRGVHITGNKISGVGREGTTGVYAGIKATTTVGKSFILHIQNNTIFGNDNAYGIQDSTIEYGILLDNSATNFSSVICTYNTLYTYIYDIPISAQASVLDAGIVFLGNAIRDTQSIVNLPINNNNLPDRIISGYDGYSSETDLNLYTENGTFSTPNGGLTNFPSGFTQGRHTLQVIGFDGSYGLQMLTPRNTNSNNFAIRTYYGTSWRNWSVITATQQ